MTQKIVLLDTGIGNIQSVANVLEYLKAPFEIGSTAEQLKAAEKIIFPGVGTYGNAMERITRKGLLEPLREAMLVARKPTLGICVGMQVMSEVGYEFGEFRGLGVVKGAVRKIEVEGGEKIRLPHVGWNEVTYRPGSRLFKDIPQGASFYFLHSYHYEPAGGDDVSCRVSYGKELVAAIERGNIHGVQFHPEKSQGHGIQLLKNFMEL